MLRGQRLPLEADARATQRPLGPLGAGDVAYMVLQRYTTAIQDAYAGRLELPQQLVEARRCRAWLDALHIDPHLRAALVEPIAVIEETFRDLVRREAP